MDEPTHRYYRGTAALLAEEYDRAASAMESVLRRAFDQGMRVLDVGAAGGRDIDLLLKMGCDAYGVEPCDELRQIGLQRRPHLVGRLQPGELPQLGLPFGGGFDGVLCCAVLMHLPRAEILDAAIALRSVLKEDGRLLLSVPVGRPGLNEEHRDSGGRLFTPLPPDYLRLLFERVGFDLVGRWESTDSLNRNGYCWCSLLLRLRHRSGSRPVDLIEGVLNRDRKTATYKLALFRALSEIATTEHEQAKWLEEGVVGVPLASVCEKWLHYYWPLVECPNFIPQIRGEAPGCAKPVAFRSALSELVRTYARRGGLHRFVLEYRAGILPETTAALLSRVLAQIRGTVVDGPVTYAGGSLESGRVFRYDRRADLILMSASIWRELSLLGHWIQDAVILRWAELTSEISRRAMRPSEVLDFLLTVPIPERDVADARQAYESNGVSECTWTGTVLHRGFQVDHIIPFSLWRNNDLWNLVPASPAVNLAKRDRLPARELMLKRRERLLECWRLLRRSHRARFDHEISRLVGVGSIPQPWENLAFQYVSEAVEFTAAQRGCERWQP